MTSISFVDAGLVVKGATISSTTSVTHRLVRGRPGPLIVGPVVGRRTPLLATSRLTSRTYTPRRLVIIGRIGTFG